MKVRRNRIGTPPLANQGLPAVVSSLWLKGAVCLFLLSTVSMAHGACMEHGIIARSGDGALSTDAQPDTQPDARPADELRFTDVYCEPDVINGEPLAPHTFLDCIFRVEGVAGRMTELWCEDGLGALLDCNEGWPPRFLDPAGPSPLPVEDGYFTIWIPEPAPPMGRVVWVADDGVGQARFDLTWHTEPNSPPEIWVECGGNGLGFVTVDAGALLECSVFTQDPDPGDDVNWQVILQQGPLPMEDPIPLWGQGPGPSFWAWQTDLLEAGEILIYRFMAHDNASPAPPFDLTVTVQ